MKIKYLELLNFRNYEKIKLEFSNNINLIYGNNGSGKTNIVEAIYLLAYTKSFRTNTDKYMIKMDKNLLKVTGLIENDYSNKHIIVINDDGKKVKINDTNYNRLSDYISKMNLILFCRDDLDLIKSSPNFRRKSINIDISGYENRYLKLLNDYNKFLKQRNSYLKSLYLNNNMSRDYLEILTNNLIHLGKKIYNFRKSFIENINKYISIYYLKIMNIEGLNIEYVSDFKYSENDICKKMKSNLSRELTFGKTLTGIHHDDILFKINKIDIKNFGSEGQQKNAIIAYKMALIKYLSELNIKPIFILDDMFSELDNEKINNILKLLNNNLQIFITTTEINNISEAIINKAYKIKVDNGKIEVN